MQKILGILLLCVFLLGGLGYLFRDSLMEVAVSQITADMYVNADSDAFDPGLPIGSEFPGIRAHYEGHAITSIDRFIHDRGMVFVANRSADWWPYCMAQFVQLQSHHSKFLDAGIALVALTYDSPEAQRAFVEKNAIAYPLLSDIEAHSVKTLGILNEEYAPGDGAYGIPHPGIFVVNPEGTIVGKIFIEGYETRVNASAVLAYALERL